MNLRKDFDRFWDEIKSLSLLIFAICLVSLLMNNYGSIYKFLITRDRPWILTRGTAANAIERSENFVIKQSFFLPSAKLRGSFLGPATISSFQIKGCRFFSNIWRTAR